MSDNDNTFIFRQHWHNNKVAYDRMIISRRDVNGRNAEKLPNAFVHLLRQAKIEDGDEIEIFVRKTGKRPFGDRRVVLQAPHVYRLESVEQMIERKSQPIVEKAPVRDRKRKVVE